MGLCAALADKAHVGLVHVFSLAAVLAADGGPCTALVGIVYMCLMGPSYFFFCAAMQVADRGVSCNEEASCVPGVSASDSLNTQLISFLSTTVACILGIRGFILKGLLESYRCNILITSYALSLFFSA